MLIISPSLHDNVDKEDVIDGYTTKWLDNINKIRTKLGRVAITFKQAYIFSALRIIP